MKFNLHLSRALFCATLAGASLLGGFAQAQDAYPTNTIRMIVPYAPGGATDTLARLVGKELSDKLGQSVVVENKSGGNTGIGASYVSRAAPDGYTILFTNDATFVLNPAVFKTLTYSMDDLMPVATVCYLNLGMAVHSSAPVNNMQEMEAYTQESDADLAYGSFGVGSHPHFMGELYKKLTRSDITHVPYKGSSPAVMDVVGNQVLFTFPALVTIQGHVKDGRVKVLAISGEERSELLPDVPTFTEAGYPDLNIGSWYGFFAPAGTPEHIIETLNSTVSEILADPAFEKRLVEQGTVPLTMTPAEMSTRMALEVEQMKVIGQDANISID